MTTYTWRVSVIDEEGNETIISERALSADETIAMVLPTFAASDHDTPVIAPGKIREKYGRVIPIVPKPKQEPNTAGALSRAEWDRVQREFAESGQTATVAEKTGLPVHEINQAVQTKQYASYLKKRV